MLDTTSKLIVRAAAARVSRLPDGTLVNDYLALEDASGEVRMTASRNARMEGSVLVDRGHFYDGQDVATEMPGIVRVVKIVSPFAGPNVPPEHKTVLWEREDD